PRHEELGDQAGPTRLVGSADAPPGVAVKIFVEQNVIPEMRVAVQLRMVAEHWTAAIGVAQEQARQPPRQLIGGVFDRDEAPGIRGAFDLEIVAVVVMELLQRLDNEVVYRKPDWPAPVRVAAKHAAIRLGGLVAHGMGDAAGPKRVRMRAVNLRQSAHAV